MSEITIKNCVSTGGSSSNFGVYAEKRANELLELRRELMRQWFTNHAEHCGALVPPWPHADDCQWPMPAIILENLSPSQVYLLLLEALGESVAPSAHNGA